MAVKFGLEIDKTSAMRLQKAMTVLGDGNADWLRDVWDDVGQLLTRNIQARAPGSIKEAVNYRGVGKSRTVGGVRASGSVKHGGSRSMEFGRVWYWTDYHIARRRIVGGKKVRRTGQKAKPYIGVIDGGHAIGATKPEAARMVMTAINKAWEGIV